MALRFPPKKRFNRYRVLQYERDPLICRGNPTVHVRGSQVVFDPGSRPRSRMKAAPKIALTDLSAKARLEFLSLLGEFCSQSGSVRLM